MLHITGCYKYIYSIFFIYFFIFYIFLYIYFFFNINKFIVKPRWFEINKIMIIPNLDKNYKYLFPKIVIFVILL